MADHEQQPDIQSPLESPDTTPEPQQGGLLQSLAATLGATGSTPEEAATLAAHYVRELSSFNAGRSWGGLHAEGIPQIVLEAMRGANGARRLVLEIEAEGEHDEWHGHLKITLKEAQTWPEWERERQERANKELN